MIGHPPQHAAHCPSDVAKASTREPRHPDLSSDERAVGPGLRNVKRHKISPSVCDRHISLFFTRVVLDFGIEVARKGLSGGEGTNEYLEGGIHRITEAGTSPLRNNGTFRCRTCARRRVIAVSTENSYQER